MSQEPVTVRQPWRESEAPKRVQVRVLLFAPGSAEHTANIWADVVEGGFALQHDYPDLHPVPGWHLEAGGHRYEITRVDGRVLACTRLEG